MRLGAGTSDAILESLHTVRRVAPYLRRTFGLGRRAREGAGEIAQDAVDRGAAVARQVVDAARESAADEGLAGKTVGHFVDEALKGDLVSSVGEIGRDVLKAGDEAIRKDGLGQRDQPASPGAQAKPTSSGERPVQGPPARP
jgi:hypothetical protein